MIVVMSLLAIFAGLMFAAQGPVNTAVAKITGTFQATMISFLGGTLVLIPVIIFFGTGDLKLLPTVQLWQLTGGMLGVIGVCTTVACMPVIGAAQTIAAIMLGQLIMSGIIDEFGLLGTDVIHISFWRILGILTVAAGIILVYLANREKTDDSNKSAKKRKRSLIYLFTAFASGLITAMQSPINASLSAVIGNWEGTFISFVVGFIVIALITLIISRGKLVSIKGKGFKPWMCLGGPLGVVGIFFSLYTVFTLGSALQVACGMVGQLIGAIIVDCFGIIVPKVKINRSRAIGVAVITAGVIIVTAARM